MTGNFGFVVLMLNSRWLVWARSKPWGNVKVALNDLPGCGSVSCTSTSLESMTGSGSAIVLVALLFWVFMSKDCLAGSGPFGSVTWGGVMVTHCAPLAQAVTAGSGEVGGSF